MLVEKIGGAERKRAASAAKPAPCRRWPPRRPTHEAAREPCSRGRSRVVAARAGCTRSGRLSAAGRRPSRGRTAARPAPPVRGAASFADQAWWDVFHDDALKGADRRGAQERLRRAARRLAGRGGARQRRHRPRAGLPDVQGQIEAGYGRQSEFSSSPGRAGEPLSSSTSTPPGRSTSGGGSGARTRRPSRSILASEEARRGVYLSLASEVATAYFQLRSLDAQLEIARRTTGAFQETFDLFDRRLKGGAASALETSSAEALLASTAANIPDLERQIVAQENQLAFLLGRNPGPIAARRGAHRPVPAAGDPAGAPRRPARAAPRPAPGRADPDRRQRRRRRRPGRLLPAHEPHRRPGLRLPPESRSSSRPAAPGRVGGGLLSPGVPGAPAAQPVRRGRRPLGGRRRCSTSRASPIRSTRSRRRWSPTRSTPRWRPSGRARWRPIRRRSACRTPLRGGALGLSRGRSRRSSSSSRPRSCLSQARYNRLATLVQLYRALGGGWQLSDPQWTAGTTAAVVPRPRGQP